MEPGTPRTHSPVPHGVDFGSAPGNTGLPGGGVARLPAQQWNARRCTWSATSSMAGSCVAAGTGPRRTTTSSRKILRQARKGTRVVFVPGNHDEFARRYVFAQLRWRRRGRGLHPRHRRRAPPVGHARRSVRWRDPVRALAGARGRRGLRVHAQGEPLVQPGPRPAGGCPTGACRATSSRRSSAPSAMSATSNTPWPARHASARCTAWSVATFTMPRCATSTASFTAMTATGSRA